MNTGDQKEQASSSQQQQQTKKYDALDSSSTTNNKLNHKHNDKNKEISKDSIDESCPTKNQPPPSEPSGSSRSGATTSSQRRRQLQFQRQREAKLYDPGPDGTSAPPAPGGELVNCIAYDDNTLVIERKPSPTSPATSRRYLKAETPTRGSRKYNRKSPTSKSDLEVVIVKPEHHHQHRSPTITLPVPKTGTTGGSSPTGSGTSASTATVLQQRYMQLQQEHEKKFIYNAMQEFDYLEHSSRNTSTTRA